MKITAIGSVANGPEGEWVCSANGVPSRYRLDTQTIEEVSRVSFSYREKGR